MPAASTREIVELLSAAGVRCWVVGGWAIDARLGRESRACKDLEVVLLVRGEHERAWRRPHDAGRGGRDAGRR